MTNKKDVGLLVGETAELPQSFIEKHQIVVVPFEVYFKEDLTGDARDQFYYKQRQGWHARTSQPTDGNLQKAFSTALDRFEEVVVVLMTGAHSKAVGAAEAVRNTSFEEQKERIHILDSRMVSVGETLFIGKLQELIDEGRKANEIMFKDKEGNEQESKEIKKLRDQINLFGILQDVKWLEEGGRLSPARARFLRRVQKLGGQLAVTLKNGHLTHAKGLIRRTGKLRGPKGTPEQMVSAVLKELEQQLGPENRVALAHADIPKQEVERLQKGTEEFGAQSINMSMVNRIIGAHCGAGAILAAWM